MPTRLVLSLALLVLGVAFGIAGSSLFRAPADPRAAGPGGGDPARPRPEGPRPAGAPVPAREKSPAPGNGPRIMITWQEPEVLELAAARIHRSLVTDDEAFLDRLRQAAGEKEESAISAHLYTRALRLLGEARAKAGPAEDEVARRLAELKRKAAADPLAYLKAEGLLRVSEEDVGEWKEAFLDALWDPPVPATVSSLAERRLQAIHQEAGRRAEALLREHLGREFASLRAKEDFLRERLDGFRARIMSDPGAFEPGAR